MRYEHGLIRLRPQRSILCFLRLMCMPYLLRQPLTGEPLPKESMDSWRLGLVRLQGLERVAPQDHLSDPALDSVETMSPTPSNEGDKPLLNSLGDDGFSLTNPGRPPFAEHVDYSPMSLPLPSEKGKPHVYSSTYAEVDVVTTTYSPKVTSPMPGQNERLEVSFESRVTMFEGLHELVKESRVTLAEIRQLTSAQATSFEDSPPVPSETLHELNRLVKMAKYLEESTVSAPWRYCLFAIGSEPRRHEYWGPPLVVRRSFVEVLLQTQDRKADVGRK